MLKKHYCQQDIGWKNMEANFLRYLPISKKPLKKRKSVSNADRIKTWKLDYNYFDGSREQGYGGYKYDGRWKPLAKAMIKHYNLNNKSRILEIGCAKGYLIKEFKDLLPKCTIYGVDISEYAISNAHIGIKKKLLIANANSLPFKKKFFDLTLSINSLHNILNLEELKESFSEIKRVSKKNMFVSVGTYENHKEKKILDEWAVLATTYMSKKNWLKFFKKVKYNGDYDWFKPR